LSTDWLNDKPNGSFCMTCGVNTSEIHEFYMLIDQTWLQANHDSFEGMLCIGCVEARLGRLLRPSDFDPYWMDQFDGYRSQRLYQRLNGAGRPENDS
jgi:hypothetical protein